MPIDPVSLPVVLTNGSTNDADEVMDDLSALEGKINEIIALLDGGLTAENLDTTTALITAPAQLGTRVVTGSALGALPGVRVRKGAQNQNINDGQAANVLWDTVDFEVGGEWITPTSATLTVPVAGIYIITVGIQWNDSNIGGNPVSNRTVKLNVNGSLVKAFTRQMRSQGSQDYMALPEGIELEVGDELTVNVSQNSGTTLRVESSPATNLSVHYVSNTPT